MSSLGAAAAVSGGPVRVPHRPCKSQADVCGDAEEPTSVEHCPFATVFANEELLVVNKPHYVRLQGDFSVTVLKLLHHHYPEVPRFWFIHQLDYATSGLLCVGLTKRCTAAASDLFSQRTTRKQYLAIVHGHVWEGRLHVRGLADAGTGPASGEGGSAGAGTAGGTSGVLGGVGGAGSEAGAGPTDDTAVPPGLPPADAGGAAWRGQRHEGPPGASGLDPALAALTKPLSRAALYRRRVVDARRRLERSTTDGAGEGGAPQDSMLLKYPRWLDFAGLVPGPLGAPSTAPAEDAAWATGLMGQLAAEEAAVGDAVRHRKKAAAGAVAAALRASGDGGDGAPGPGAAIALAAPAVEDVPDGWARGPEVTINLPVASLGADEFRMCVGGRDNPGDPATTALRVLRRGVLAKGGQPATLVLLRPLTGRRHQLRVHCCAIGHPIVGDATYCPGMDEEPRMYLHAWKLELPFSTASKCSIKAPLALATEEPFGRGVLTNGPSEPVEPAP